MRPSWLTGLVQWFRGSKGETSTKEAHAAPPERSEPAARQRPPHEDQAEAAAPPPATAPQQVPPVKRSRGATDVVMGLDFGTSCSKVVVQTPFLAGGRALAIPFDVSRRGIGRFLAPTNLVAGADGEPALGRPVDASEDWKSIKVDLMEQPESRDSRARAAAYLALVIRDAMTRYLDHERRNLEGFDLRWEMNVGIPSAGYDDARIRSSFLRTARAAWALATSGEPIRLARAAELVDAEMDLPAIDVVPEVAAEVVGYARSSYRRSGLHLLVDVGASTVDVCGFILDEREGDTQYALLTALVERRGAHELHRARIRGIQRLNPSALRADIRNEDLSDPSAAIPGSISAYVSASGLDRELALIEEPLIAGCREQVMRCLKDLKKHRYPNAPEWRTGLRVFLCGGGAHVDAYVEALADANRSTLNAGWANEPLVIGPLPVPPRLENPHIGEGDFQRLAVAYGLSFSRIDIGTILPPEQIPDVPPKMRKAEVEFVSKDLV